MSDRLKEISDQLYQDGILKAEKQAESIINKAELLAQQKIRDAQDESDKLLNKTKEDILKLNKISVHELQQCSNKIILNLKEEIEQLLFNTILRKASKPLSDPERLIEIINLLMKSWQGSANTSISLKIPKLLEKEICDSFESALKQELDQGLSFDTSIDLKDGFEIINTDDKYFIRFNEESLSEFFKNQLSSKFYDLLFPQQNANHEK